jgi:hypothetical protein
MNTHAAFALAATLALSLPATLPAHAAGETMTVWKSPWCGCCEAWSDAMRAAGYEIVIENREDLAPVKAKAGVPAAMEGCHTALVEGYFLEGHVPLSSVGRLLANRPPIAGLAVPGMPSGSLGMGEDPAARYDVRSVDRSGATGIYERVGAR